MEGYLNAALLRVDGVDGKNAPTKKQMAGVWLVIGILVGRLL